MIMASNENFGGYKWEGLSNDLGDDAFSAFGRWFLDAIDWNALCWYASQCKGDEECTIDPQLTLGGRHMVRIIKVQGGSRWIARLRMTSNMDGVEQSSLVQREVDCMQLVRERTSVLMPMIFGYVASPKSAVGAPFMLMECLSGKVGMELNVDFISSQYKDKFYTEMARFQVSPMSFDTNNIISVQF